MPYDAIPARRRRRGSCKELLEICLDNSGQCLPKNGCSMKRGTCTPTVITCLDLLSNSIRTRTIPETTAEPIPESSSDPIPVTTPKSIPEEMPDRLPEQILYKPNGRSKNAFRVEGSHEKVIKSIEIREKEIISFESKKVYKRIIT